jgi:hypothetical protein
MLHKPSAVFACAFADHDREARARDHVEALRIEADQHALFEAVKVRQEQERKDLLHETYEKYRRSDWTAHFVTTSEESDLVTFSPGYLEPLVNQAMSNPFSWAPNRSASAYSSVFESLGEINPVYHLGEGQTRFDKMLKEK